VLVSLGDAVPVAGTVVPGPVLVVELFVLEDLVDPELVVILTLVVVEKVFGSVAATLVAGRVWVSFRVLSEVLRTLVTASLPKPLTISLLEEKNRRFFGGVTLTRGCCSRTLRSGSSSTRGRRSIFRFRADDWLNALGIKASISE